MVKLWLKREDGGLMPYDQHGFEVYERIPWDTPLRADVTQPRNYERLKLRWALIHIVAKGLGEDEDDISDEIKIACGHYKEVIRRDGAIDRKPLSISYESMDEIPFREHFEKEVQAIYMLYGILPADIRAKLDEILAPKTERHR